MNPILKQHIERYIDDIDKGNLLNSIIYCPLDIMSDYLDALRMIDEVIPGHLIPYTRISCYLASVLKGGHMCNITMRSIGDETYEFQFPLSNITFDDTLEEWNNVSISPSAFTKVPARTITCIDGVTKLRH